MSTGARQAHVVAFVSFRLGGHDGVSVVTDTWRRCFTDLGWETVTVAGEGDADRLVPGLAIDAAEPPAPSELDGALAGADLVVAENILTIPLNLPASAVVAEVLRGRPTLVHHHDPPWHRARFADVTALPAVDPSWWHVTISRYAQHEFADRGIATDVVYNAVDAQRPPGDGPAMRRRIGADAERPLALHPVRAIERKNVPGALALAEAIGATYWLPGPAEEGYGPTLDALLRAAKVPVLRVPFDQTDLAAAYAAADAVLYPSTWEGFGIPPLEAAVFRRPVVVGDYPVARELRALGFRWLPADGPGPLERVLADPASIVDELELNNALVRRHFSIDRMRDSLDEVLSRAGWWS